MTNPTTAQPKTALDAHIDGVVQRVCEWADRTSPEDFPDALLITPEELTSLLRDFAAFVRVQAVSPETPGASQDDDTPESIAAKLRALDDEGIRFTDIAPLLREAADLLEARAAEIARLTILASRSELSAVAKALAWEGPYQCSLAGRVKGLIHDNDLIRKNTKVVERQRDTALAKLEALREALGGLAKGETVVFDADDLGENVITLMDEDEMDEDEMRDIARNALSTEAAPPPAQGREGGERG